MNVYTCRYTYIYLKKIIYEYKNWNINEFSHLKSLLVAKITLNGLSCRIIRYRKGERKEKKKNSIKNFRTIPIMVVEFVNIKNMEHQIFQLSSSFWVRPCYLQKNIVYIFSPIFSSHLFCLTWNFSNSSNFFDIFCSFSHWITTNKKRNKIIYKVSV